MKILVTGGSGFIGKVLIKKLLSQGYKVNCLDESEIDFKHRNLKFFKGSILSLKKLELSAIGANKIIHLAALMGVQNTDNNFIDCLDINILGTREVLTVAKKNNIKHVILTSSSEIYGDQINFPIYENFETKNKSVYALSKNTAEAYVKVFSKI